MRTTSPEHYVLLTMNRDRMLCSDAGDIPRNRVANRFVNGNDLAFSSEVYVSERHVRRVYLPPLPLVRKERDRRRTMGKPCHDSISLWLSC